MSDDENEVGQAQPQPVAIHLPPVKEFDPKEDPSTVSQRWQKWKKSFVYFLNATGIQNASQKRAALLHLVGDEVQDIFETLGEVGTTYEQAITKLEGYFGVCGIAVSGVISARYCGIKGKNWRYCGIEFLQCGMRYRYIPGVPKKSIRIWSTLAIRI